VIRRESQVMNGLGATLGTQPQQRSRMFAKERAKFVSASIVITDKYTLCATYGNHDRRKSAQLSVLLFFTRTSVGGCRTG
jgi:hypothetical protein